MLSEADPDNADAYLSNAEARIAAIETLQSSTAETLRSSNDFAVMHDSLRYFTNRFGLEAPLALADSEANQPGPARVAELQGQAAERQINCVLTEPGASDRLIKTVFEAQEIKAVEFDPAGSLHVPGPGLYTQLLTSLGGIIANCKSE